MRGRKPKPTAQKRLEGNPGKRPLNASEPQFELGIPEPPAYLSQKAREEWARVTPELNKSGVLAKIHQAALAAYCQWYAVFVQAAEKVEAGESPVQVTQTGYESPSAWLSVMKQASEQMRKYQTEFGMTPSSQTRLKAMPPPPKDPFDEFMADGGDVVGRIG